MRTKEEKLFALGHAVADLQTARTLVAQLTETLRSCRNEAGNYLNSKQRTALMKQIELLRKQTTTIGDIELALNRHIPKGEE